MIRINLLPQANRQVASFGPGTAQIWYIIYAGSTATFCLILGIVYYIYYSSLQEKLAVNSRLEAEIASIRQRSSKLEEVQQALEKSHSLEEVVGELQRQKTGPIRLMMELSRILSQDGGPTIDAAELERLRRENPLAGFNPAWDPRRLSLISYEEDQPTDGIVTIEGEGRTNEDVAEFLRRLELSELFSEVRLTKTETEQNQSAPGLNTIKFQMTCTVTY